jgi:deoxyribodipyrimidine photo-lyase
VLRRGAADVEVPRLAAELGAAEVHWNAGVDPSARAEDARVRAALAKAGRDAVAHPTVALLVDPTMTVRPFRNFAAFWRAARPVLPGRTPLAGPKRLTPPAALPASDALESWRLQPRRANWASGFADCWRPGEAGAAAALARFADERLAGYAEARDQLASQGTSRLSPHLHFGEITPAQVWLAAEAAVGGERFFAELGWREFAHHLLHHSPDLPTTPQRAAFAAFPWRNDAAGLAAWRRGETGYPIVDAGMRELWATGYMHNRARMIVASFLTKHLLIDWREGAAWFWDTLVDADLANNAASWQWAAGAGVDAVPYFRIFNPVLQGERFDAEGAYVRRWVPELARLPTAFVHKPWTAPRDALDAAGVALGRTYPRPIVDHAGARARALAAFQTTKSV